MSIFARFAERLQARRGTSGLQLSSRIPLWNPTECLDLRASCGALIGLRGAEVWEAGRMDPVRTCVACRLRASRGELLRVVLREGRLIPDDRAVLSGRGAWVHPSAECLRQAVSRGMILRALRASGDIDASPIENRLETLMDN